MNNKNIEKLSIADIEKYAEETNTDLNKLLGNFYLQKKDYINSIKNFEIYIKTNPNDPIALGILGYLYDMLYIKTKNNIYIKIAIKYTEKAYSLQKNNSKIALSLAIMYKDIGLKEQALELWPDILKNNQTDKIYYDYALLCLSLGDFEEYYKYCDHRLNLTIVNLYPKFKEPQWQGESILDSTLLVHWEQGCGDTIMYSRYLKYITNKAKKVIFIVQKGLEELFKNNNFGCEVYSDISQAGKFDYHVPLISLPKILGVSADNLICNEKYLNVDNQTVELFKNKYFKTDKYKIAIKYRGNIDGPISRNIPYEKIYKIFDNLKDVEIYSFQFEDEYKNSDIINLKNTTKNFYETAAIIKNMDLVITSDNVILHLAGALGKKTYGLFNFTAESRWFDLKGDDTKWYKNITPYSAPELNNWDALMKNVIQDLSQNEFISN